MFLYYEISTRFPNEDEFEFVERPKNVVSPLKLPSFGKDKDEQVRANGVHPHAEEAFRDSQK